MSDPDRASAHVARFNAAVRAGAWAEFAQRFTDDARMTFTDVPAGPFEGRAAILAGYQARPPTDTMRVDGVETVDEDTDVVRFTWEHGGPGTMRIGWRGDRVADLEITFG